jgi:hypothetical protein
MTRLIHHLIKTAPHVTPAPNADISTKSPFFKRPLCAHSSKQMGIEAEEVFPMRAMLE